MATNRNNIVKLVLERIQSIECLDCGAKAKGSELTQEDVDLIKEIERCPMCSADASELLIVYKVKPSSPIELTSHYWDCECEKNYIHADSRRICIVCTALRESQPDSRVGEVLAAGFYIPGIEVLVEETEQAEKLP